MSLINLLSFLPSQQLACPCQANPGIHGTREANRDPWDWIIPVPDLERGPNETRLPRGALTPLPHIELREAMARGGAGRGRREATPSDYDDYYRSYEPLGRARMHRQRNIIWGQGGAAALWQHRCGNGFSVLLQYWASASLEFGPSVAQLDLLWMSAPEASSTNMPCDPTCVWPGGLVWSQCGDRDQVIRTMRFRPENV
jgi:hypothetical protein